MQNSAFISWHYGMRQLSRSLIIWAAAWSAGIARASGDRLFVSQGNTAMLQVMSRAGAYSFPATRWRVTWTRPDGESATLESDLACAKGMCVVVVPALDGPRLVYLRPVTAVEGQEPAVVGVDVIYWRTSGGESAKVKSLKRSGTTGDLFKNADADGSYILQQIGRSLGTIRTRYFAPGIGIPTYTPASSDKVWVAAPATRYELVVFEHADFPDNPNVMDFSETLLKREPRSRMQMYGLGRRTFGKSFAHTLVPIYRNLNRLDTGPVPVFLKPVMRTITRDFFDKPSAWVEPTSGVTYVLDPRLGGESPGP